MQRVRGATAAALLTLVACGGGAAPVPTASPPGVPAAAAAAAITAQGFTFKPDALQVSAGTTVTWTNNDSAPHTATSGTPAAKDGRFRGDLGGSGGKFSFTFAQAGTFGFFCEIHTDMKGTITVR